MTREMEYQQAAAAGDTSAMYNLGQLYRHEFDPPDLAAARRWYEKAAEGGYTKAYFDLAYLLENQDLPSAMEWYEKAAAHGNATAMYNLGVLSESQDLQSAVEW